MTFIKTLSFDWLPVDEAEKSMLASDLRSVMPKGTREEQFRAEVYVKVGTSECRSPDTVMEMRCTWSLQCTVFIFGFRKRTDLTSLFLSSPPSFPI